MTTQLDRIEAQGKLTAAKVDRIDEVVTGNGNPSKGLIVRVDRLEQWRKFLVFIVTTAFVGGVSAVWSWVKFGGRAG